MNSTLRDDSDEVCIVPLDAPAAQQPWGVGRNGATNFSRGQAQRFARDLLQSQAYRDSLEERVKKGTLAPGVEQMLWHYAWGKPIEQVQVTVAPGEQDLSTLSIVELQDALQKMSKTLEEAQALEDAIPASYKVSP